MGSTETKKPDPRPRLRVMLKHELAATERLHKKGKTTEAMIRQKNANALEAAIAALGAQIGTEAV